MNKTIVVTASILGMFSIILGAFGAHALKELIPFESQQTFETGVRYQMYHALIIIISGVIFPFIETSQQIMGWCFILGVILFSFSIYGLCLSAANNNKWKFLGPITPLGGLLLLIGWILFAINASEIAIYL